MSRLRDADIRSALRESVFSHYRGDPETVVIEELGIRQGAVRVDVAVVNGTLHGYEIKSEADTLDRLPHQAEIYSQAFDRVTLVVPERHINQATGLVPDWWAILVPIHSEGEVSVRFSIVRSGRNNPQINPRVVAEFLWRDEVLELLAAKNADAGFRSKPRRVLWDQLCKVYTLDEIRQFVRNRLRARSGGLHHLT